MVASKNLLIYDKTKTKNSKKKDKESVRFLLLGRHHFETHTATWHVSNHNLDKVFPRFDKMIERISDENCCQLSLRSALQGLQEGGENIRASTFLAKMWGKCTRDDFQTVVERRIRINIEKRESRGIAAPHVKSKQIYVNGKTKTVPVWDLPPDMSSCYGSQAEGYKGGDLVNYVRDLNEEFDNERGNMRLQIKSLTKMHFKQLLELTAKRRKGRVFVMFGRSGSTEKRKELVDKVHSSQLCCHTKKLPHLKGFMPSGYYSSKAKMPEHAICVKYDKEGNGTMDDPAKKTYRAVTLENLYAGLVDLHCVYELTLGSVDLIN
jgi:hypothetical protein